MPAPKNGAPRNNSSTGCLRCGYAVYEAEKLIAAGRVRIYKSCSPDQLTNSEKKNSNSNEFIAISNHFVTL